MPSIPTLDWWETSRPDASEALQTGCFYARHPLFPAARCQQAIDLAQAFFDLPSPVKHSIAIENSPHFRGYSEMRNERDWREQIHFGREELSPSSESRAFNRLRGPNLWPPDPAWRSSLLSLIADLERAAREILHTVAGETLLSPDERSYLLLKLIHYHPTPEGIVRSGVAPHVDFSWITLLLQDDTGGLEIQTPAGDWLAVPPKPGTIVVNFGEVLQFASGGRFLATPHRVSTRPSRRVSLPFFLNPGLDTTVDPKGPSAIPNGGIHIHRVLDAPSTEPMHFGEAEWRRKGLGVWCTECQSRNVRI